MALQGTIDAFPLTDVLQLLSSSAKSGRLLLEGDRGSAALWIEDGSVVGGQGGRTGSSTAALLVLEMLRFTDGSFVFDALGDAATEQMSDVEPVDLASCVDEAASLLEQWQRIEAVVPSGAHRVALVEELVEDTVSIERSDWPFVVAAGGSPTVDELAAQLGLDEFECSSAIAVLVARSLVRIDEPDVVSPSVADLGVQEQLERTPEIRATDGSPDEAFPERFPIDDFVAADLVEPDGWSPAEAESQRFAAAQTFEPLGADVNGVARLGDVADDLPERTAEAWDEVVTGRSPAALDEQWQEPLADPAEQLAADETADEVLRQMSRLSPKAAEAIAAALGSTPAAATAPPADDTTRRDNDGPITYMGSF